MSELFHRAWKVSIRPSDDAKADLENETLRVVFHVTKTLQKEPNTMNLQISNLSDASRSKLVAKGMSVTLEAGYKDEDRRINTRAVIFSGHTRICDHKHEGPEWMTRIQCGDGESIINRSDRFAKSYAANFQLAGVIRDVAKTMKVNTGNLNDALNQFNLPFKKFAYGYSANGSVFDVFDDLMKTAGFTWSVQQGALQIMQRDNTAVIEDVVVLNKGSGLIGSPEHTPPHKSKKPSYLTAKCLLNPKIRPGGTVRMDSINVKGDFVCQKVEHHGDSHGPEWTTQFEALAASDKQKANSEVVG